MVLEVSGVRGEMGWQRPPRRVGVGWVKRGDAGSRT